MKSSRLLLAVTPPTLRTDKVSCGIPVPQAVAMAAHPAFLDSGHARHKGVITHIHSNDCTGSDKAVSADGVPADSGCFRSDRRAPPYQSLSILISSHDLR